MRGFRDRRAAAVDLHIRMASQKKHLIDRGFDGFPLVPDVPVGKNDFRKGVFEEFRERLDSVFGVGADFACHADVDEVRELGGLVGDDFDAEPGFRRFPFEIGSQFLQEFALGVHDSRERHLVSVRRIVAGMLNASDLIEENAVHAELQREINMPEKNFLP